MDSTHRVVNDLNKFRGSYSDYLLDHLSMGILNSKRYNLDSKLATDWSDRGVEEGRKGIFMLDEDNSIRLPHSKTWIEIHFEGNATPNPELDKKLHLVRAKAIYAEEVAPDLLRVFLFALPSETQYNTEKPLSDYYKSVWYLGPLMHLISIGKFFNESQSFKEWSIGKEIGFESPTIQFNKTNIIYSWIANPECYQGNLQEVQNLAEVDKRSLYILYNTIILIRDRDSRIKEVRNR